MDLLQEFKDKKLEILHELDRVCQKEGIKYFLAYGTLLGAVRHHGYIPWDDDIDVFMEFSEYEKLRTKARSFQEKYFLQDIYTENNYNSMKVSLRDSSTSFFYNDKDNKDINHGIYIDIYLLFPYPDNFFKAHKLILDSYILRILYARDVPQNHGNNVKKVSQIILELYKGNRREKKIKKIENTLKNNGGKKYLSSYYGEDITPISTFKFPADYFKKAQYLTFEDFDAPCPSNPEDICRITYGSTYMELPPEEDRQPRHNIKFVDFNEPYTKYEGVYYRKDKDYRKGDR